MIAKILKKLIIGLIGLEGFWRHKSPARGHITGVSREWPWVAHRATPEIWLATPGATPLS